VELRSNTKKRK